MWFQSRSLEASNNPGRMYVVKRDGRKEKVHFDKITSRIRKLCYGLNENFVEVSAALRPDLPGSHLRSLTACAGGPEGVHGRVQGSDHS